MRHTKSLSCLVAASVVGLSVTAPALAFAADPGTPPADALAPVAAPDSEVVAQGSDHMKANRTWRQMNVKWDWTMPDGVPQTDANQVPQEPMSAVPGYPQAGNALYGPLPSGAAPEYDVVLDADGTNLNGRIGQLSCEWNIDTPDPVDIGPKPCTDTKKVGLPEGTWPLELTVTDDKSGVAKTVESEIEVRNVLYAIAGDSYASGEGYPPLYTEAGGKRYIAWDEPGCDRSRWSGFVRAAAQAEQVDPRSNVTVVDVACSAARLLAQSGNQDVPATGGMQRPQLVTVQGATVNGKFQPGPTAVQSSVYSGDPANPGYFPPQVDQLNAIAGGKSYDVMFFSTGGYDDVLNLAIQSCQTFDSGSVMLNQVLTDYEASVPPPARQSTAITPYPGCYANGQAVSSPELGAAQTGGTQAIDLNARCVGSTAADDFLQINEIIQGCQNVNGYRYKALSSVINGNLADLNNEMELLAPCLGSNGNGKTCQTQKSAGAAFTDSPAVKIGSLDNVAQTMYPDLTQESNGKDGLQPCSVQQNPTQPSGAQIIPDPTDPLNAADWQFDISKALTNPLESLATQVDNTWILGQLYNGKEGTPIAIPGPQNTGQYTNNVPLLFVSDNAFIKSISSESLVTPFTFAAPPNVTPTADGLVVQLLQDAKSFGWVAATDVYDWSHTHGMCAGENWVTNLTEDTGTKALLLDGGTSGYGFHPNASGQAAYASMLGPMAIDMAELPIDPAETSVIPFDSEKSKTKAKAQKKTVKPGQRAKIKIRVIGQGGDKPTGRIQVRGNKSSHARWMKKEVKLNQNGKVTFKTPASWSKLKGSTSKANLRLKIRYLGDGDYGASNAKQMKIKIRR